MSDLAVVDIGVSEQRVKARPFAIVGPFRSHDAGTDATVAALTRAIPGEPVAGSALDDRGSVVVDIGDRKLINRSISDAEIVVVAGPSLGPDIGSATRLARLVYEARLRRQVVALVGLSVEAPRSATSRWLARTAIHNADLTILRDDASAAELIKAGVEPPLRVGADPAWVELGELFAAPKQNENVIVALDDHFGDVHHLARALGPVAASGLPVVLQSWSRTTHASGSSIAERVAERVGNNASVIDGPKTLREARDLYSAGRAVLALHVYAVMAAASAGSRTLALGDNEMARLVTTLKLPVLPANSAPSDIGSALLRTVESGPLGSRAVPQLIDRAKASVDLLRLLITEGEDISQSAINPLPFYPTPWCQ